MENNSNKKGKGLIIVIILLVLIILGLVGYICYDKGIILKPKQVATTNKVNNKEELDINSGLVTNLFNIFRLDNLGYKGVYEDTINNSNLAKLRIAYENIAIKDLNRYFPCSDLEFLNETAYCGEMNNEMSEAYKNQDMQKFEEAEKENFSESISADIMEAKIRELFGSDYQIKHESFGTLYCSTEPSCDYMKYDQKNNAYVHFYGECGCAGGAEKEKLISAYKKDNQLVINAEIIEPNDASKSKVTYTFKKDAINDNYVFEKVVVE